MGHQFYNNHKYNKFNGIHKIESKETGKSKKFIELAKCLYLNLAILKSVNYSIKNGYNSKFHIEQIQGYW